MKWTFAQNNGGQETGFNDAGVETFKGNFYQYLPRELIQNSLDARYDQNKPVEVRFTIEDIPIREIPDSERLADAMQRCAEYSTKAMKKAKEFFETAKKLLSGKTIHCLRIGDYNTYGVRGSDTDKEMNWYNLVRSSGSSSKGAGEGGSFGIGKNAPFAPSQLRTVFYSTRNTDGETAFQGVAKLTTHQHPDGDLAQPTGFLGGDKGKSVRKASDIPAHFLRDKLGTDVIILGFTADSGWQDELVRSVLDNFWPAIEFEALEVQVGDQRISKDSLPGLLEKYAGSEDFSAHLYYRTFKHPSQSFPRKLPILDDVSLYLQVGEADLPKKIAMIRKTGMVIYKRPRRSLLPFCGVFLCLNDKGNQTLREMEPPRHDEWDPDHPEKGAHKKTEAELRAFIGECVKALTPTDDSKTIPVPGLNRFLPDDEEAQEAGFGDGPKENGKTESYEKRPKEQGLAGRKIDPKRRQTQPDEARLGAGEDETEEPGGDGMGGGPKWGDGGPGGGCLVPEPESGGGNGGSEGKDSVGGPGGEGGKPAIPISYRTYIRNPEAGVYFAVVSLKRKGTVHAILRINGIGDDGGKTAAEIRQARTPSGHSLDVKGNTVGPVQLSSSQPVKLEIILKEPARVAMEVEAHEAE